MNPSGGLISKGHPLGATGSRAVRRADLAAARRGRQAPGRRRQGRAAAQPRPRRRRRRGRSTARADSVEQVGLLAHDAFVQRLEAEPAGERGADLAGGDAWPARRRCGIGVPAASARSCDWHVRSMVMNHQAASSTVWPTVSRPWLRRMTALCVAEGVGDPLALLDVEHDAGVVVEQRVVVVEGADVLGERVERAAERSTTTCRTSSGRGRRPPRRAGRRGPGSGWRTRRWLTGRSPSTTSPWWLTRMRSRHPDLAEVHAERVDPEVVGPLRVAGGDVPGDALVEPEVGRRGGRRRPAAACGAAARPQRSRSGGAWGGSASSSRRPGYAAGPGIGLNCGL